MTGLDQQPKKPCKFCKLMGHFPYQCRLNPKVILRRKTGLKRTPIKKVGKHTKQWLVTRASWIRHNPPPIEGQFWLCYLRIHPFCPVRLTLETLTLDHVVSRSRDPKLRYNADNLKPACKYCNSEKGSRSLEQVRKNAV